LTRRALGWFAVVSLSFVVVAGVAVTVHVRMVSHSANSADPLQAAAEQLRDKPSGTALARLDELYAGLCDPATGEPDAPSSAAGIRKAIDALRDASDADRNNSMLHRLLGQYLLAGGLNGAAVKELRTAGDLGEAGDRLAVPLSVALLRADQLENLLALPVTPVAAPHQRAILYMLHARAAETLGRYPLAIVSLQKALDIEPRDLNVIVGLGMLYLWHGDLTIAAQWLDQATRTDPEATATLRLRGEYAYAVRDFAGSAAAYGKLVAMGAPERYQPIPPCLGLARAQIYQRDLQSAAGTLAHSRLPGDDPNLGYFRALLAYRSGAFQRAGDIAEPLLNRLHDYPAVYLLLGGARLASGYPETARRYLERYVDEVPSNSIAQVLLDDAVQLEANPGAARPDVSGQLYAALGFTITPADAKATP
jgi:tetratricopeptide (TPR) repeat protein